MNKADETVLRELLACFFRTAQIKPVDVGEVEHCCNEIISFVNMILEDSK